FKLKTPYRQRSLRSKDRAPPDRTVRVLSQCQQPKRPLGVNEEDQTLGQGWTQPARSAIGPPSGV
ncbi:MAG: hypothetical protein VX809_07410, partial [Pseudomonadota bacterium]|nr:hypothetical protein [Pseudomonadota bacterium]